MVKWDILFLDKRLPTGPHVQKASRWAGAGTIEVPQSRCLPDGRGEARVEARPGPRGSDGGVSPRESAERTMEPAAGTRVSTMDAPAEDPAVLMERPVRWPTDGQDGHVK